METMIKIDNVTKRTKDGTVLIRDINLQVEKGSIVGLVGRNGSGKTVLLKMVCGLMKISEGTIEIDGIEYNSKSNKIPKSIGAIIETPGFLENMSGIKNLEYLAEVRGKIGRREIIGIMDDVGLSYMSKKPVRNYSLGMRQRLAIAQALMENPNVLILDEPFNGLDNDGVRVMRNLLLSYKRRGATILLTSHNEEDIEKLCDKVYEMEAGHLKPSTK
jgi:ABC-2 type transport system ATP-binding protein